MSRDDVWLVWAGDNFKICGRWLTKDLAERHARLRDALRPDLGPHTVEHIWRALEPG